MKDAMQPLADALKDKFAAMQAPSLRFATVMAA